MRDDLHIDMMNAIIQKSGFESAEFLSGSGCFARATGSSLLTVTMSLVPGIDSMSSSEPTSSSDRCISDSLLFVWRSAWPVRSFGRSGRGNTKITKKPINSETLDMTAVEVGEIDTKEINTQDKEESSRVARHSEFGNCPIQESAESQGCYLGN